MRPPKLVKSYVLSFCRSIVTEPQPVYVPIRPLKGALKDECFSVVQSHVREHGGERVVGWSIWEWPRVLIEAIFHCVWHQPDGSLVDLTPKAVPMPRILFLPDPRRTYEGQQVSDVRRPLDHDPTIRRFCELATLIHKELNRGELASYHGEVEMTPVLQRYYAEKERLSAFLYRRYPFMPEPMP